MSQENYAWPCDVSDSNDVNTNVIFRIERGFATEDFEEEQ